MKFYGKEIYDICDSVTNRQLSHNIANWDYGRTHNLPLFAEFVLKMNLHRQDWYYEHKHPHISAFEIPQNGILYIEHDNQTVAVHPGEVYFLPAGEYNRLSVKADTDFCKLSVGFCGCGFSTFANALFGNQRLFPAAPLLPILQEKLENIFTLLKRQDIASLPELVADGTWFLMALAGCIDRGIHPKVSDAIRLFEFNFGDAHCIDLTATALKISKYQLTVLFKQHLQTSPKQYLIALRMKKAAEFLQNNHMLIKEVARQTGYASPRIFARVFHKFYGSSPQNFRLQ